MEPRNGYINVHMRHLDGSQEPAERTQTVEWLGKRYDAIPPTQKFHVDRATRLLIQQAYLLKPLRDAANEIANTIERLPRNTDLETLYHSYENATEAWSAYAGGVEALMKAIDRLMRTHRFNGLPEESLEIQSTIRQKLILQPVYEQAETQARWAEERMMQLESEDPHKVPWFPSGHERLVRKRQEATEFLTQTPMDYEQPRLIPEGRGRWVPAKRFGPTMAVAALWVYIDENDIIRQRVVRKDTAISAQMWMDAHGWAGDPKTKQGRIPMEYHLQRRLNLRPEAQHCVVEALKCEVDVKRDHYRLYTAFCPYGDVDDVTDAYRMRREFVPEAWVWALFDILVEAGCMMERGGIYHLPKEEWKQIVHRDLKPGNIFLDLEDPSRYPRYPQVRLADFGLGFETSEDDEMNPKVWNPGSGTPGFWPPEQLSFINSQTHEPVDAFQLLAHTNVWGVGAILYDVMHNGGINRTTQPDYLPGGKKKYVCNDGVRNHYTQNLVSLVEDCMTFDPAKRPTFLQLRAFVRGVLEIPPEDPQGPKISMFEHLYHARRGKHVNSTFNILNIVDQYKLGFAMAMGRGVAGPPQRAPKVILVESGAQEDSDEYIAGSA